MRPSQSEWSCRPSRSGSYEAMGPMERRIKEGLPHLAASPSLVPEPALKVAAPEEIEESGLLGELLQSQLALWTLSLSSLFTWIWTSRKRCLLFNVFFLLPSWLAATAALSSALVVFVSVGRLVLGSAGSSRVPGWVVRRLPEPASPALLRRRRSLLAVQQHSMRNRRYRALAGSSSSSSAAQQPSLASSASNPKLSACGQSLSHQPSYFWQRSHSPPSASLRRPSPAHFRG